jgi:hypothetical protein
LKGISSGEKNQFWNGGTGRKPRDYTYIRNVINPFVLELFGQRSGFSGEVDSYSMPLEIHHNFFGMKQHMIV